MSVFCLLLFVVDAFIILEFHKFTSNEKIAKLNRRFALKNLLIYVSSKPRKWKIYDDKASSNAPREYRYVEVWEEKEEEEMLLRIKIKLIIFAWDENRINGKCFMTAARKVIWNICEYSSRVQYFRPFTCL